MFIVMVWIEKMTFTLLFQQLFSDANMYCLLRVLSQISVIVCTYCRHLWLLLQIHAISTVCGSIILILEEN